MAIISHQHLVWLVTSCGAGLILLGVLLFETDSERRFSNLEIHNELHRGGMPLDSFGGQVFESLQRFAPNEEQIDFMDTVFVKEVGTGFSAYLKEVDPKDQLSDNCAAGNMEKCILSSTMTLSTIESSKELIGELMQAASFRTPSLLEEPSTKDRTNLQTKTLPKRCAGYGEMCHCNAKASAGPFGTTGNGDSVVIITRNSDKQCVGRGNHCSWYEALTLGTSATTTTENLYLSKPATSSWKEAAINKADGTSDTGEKLKSGTAAHFKCQLPDGIEATDGIADDVKNIQCFCHSTDSFLTQSQAFAEAMTGGRDFAKEKDAPVIGQVPADDSDKDVDFDGGTAYKFATDLNDALKVEENGDPEGNFCIYYDMYHDVYKTSFDHNDPLYWMTLVGSICGGVLLLWHGGVLTKIPIVAENAESVFAVLAHTGSLVFIWVATTGALTAIATTQCFTTSEDTDNWSRDIRAPEILVIIGSLCFFGGVAYHHRSLRQGLIDDTSKGGTSPVVATYHVVNFGVSTCQVIFSIVVATSENVWEINNQPHCDAQDGLNTLYAVSLFVFTGCCFLEGCIGIAELIDPKSERTRGMKQLVDILIYPEYIAAGLTTIGLTTATTSYNHCSSLVNTPGNSNYIYAFPLVIGLSGVPYLQFAFSRGEGQAGTTGSIGVYSPGSLVV